MDEKQNMVKIKEQEVNQPTCTMSHFCAAQEDSLQLLSRIYTLYLSSLIWNKLIDVTTFVEE